jgi:hypothetical protein
MVGSLYFCSKLLHKHQFNIAIQMYIELGNNANSIKENLTCTHISVYARQNENTVSI